MDDLISRQAAIANMNKVIMFRTNQEWKDRVAAYLKSLPSAQPEQRWTPCSEGLPEEKDAGILKKLGINKRSDDVIATVDVNGARMTVTACTHDGKWNWNMKYAFPNFKVIAWMPLPKPYEEDDNETD